MIDTILLDIDGVCNRFQYHVLNSLGVPYPDDSAYPVECGWNIVAAANKLLGEERFTASKFWRSITREVWATVPLSFEFSELFDWARGEVGTYGVYFLSSPTLDPDSLAGKLEWIQRFAPPSMERQFLIGPSKELCTKPSAILIDDSDKNVELFRKAGGKAVLFPRPWNSLHGRDPLDYIIGERDASSEDDEER